MAELPHDETLERDLLGRLLLAPDEVVDAMDLTPDDFWAPRHQHIWAAVVACHQRGEKLDHELLRAQLVAAGRLQPGMDEYLLCLSDGLPGTPAAAMAHRLRSLAMMRSVASACRDAYAEALQPVADPQEYVERVLGRIAGHRISRAEEMVDIAAAAADAVSWLEDCSGRPDGVVGVPTYLYPLDRLLGGLRRGEMTVLCGSPGAGKSALALSIARQVSAQIGPVCLFSLEMPIQQNVLRLLADESGIPLHGLVRAKIGTAEWPRLVTATDRIGRAQLWVYDRPSTMRQIEARIRRVMVQQGQVALVVVDYLQLIRPPAATGRGRSRAEEVADCSRDLKLLAKEYNCPVLALASLNRSAEKRENKRPMMSDLRESGAIEFDADQIIALYRADKYRDQSSARDGECEIIVLKNRQGPIGTVTVRFDAAHTRFLAKPEVGNDDSWID